MILNRTQKAILDRLWNGEQTEHLGPVLGISRTSVVRQKRRLYEYAGAKTAVQLVRYALQEGWIRL
jgi:DNA-binding CsgD family transcriptional regulator